MLDVAMVNCKIVKPSGIIRSGIGIRDGKIVALASDDALPEASRTIDGGGNYVIPGLVDAHIHLWVPVPGWDFVPIIKSETQACAAGGCTTAIHASYPFVGDIVERAKEFVKGYEEVAYVDLALNTAVYTREQIKQMPRAVEYGMPAIKLTLPYKGTEIGMPGRPAIDDGIAYLAFEESGRLAKQGYRTLVRVHCENVEIFFRLKERFLEEGIEPSSWDEARPRVCEEEAMRMCLYFASVTGATLYVVHLGIKEGVDLVRKAKAEGINVIAETCHQYLALNTGNADRILSKVNVPLREPEDNEGLWQGIRDGIISVVATDHGGMRKERKKGNLWEASVGFAGVETWLPVMLSEGVNKGRISFEKLVEVCCYNPARIYGLAPRKGMIEVGSDADLVIVDLKKEDIVPEQPIYSASDFSVWAGWRLTGWPILTMLRGKVVFEDGKVIGESGYGRYIPAQVKA